MTPTSTLAIVCGACYGRHDDGRARFKCDLYVGHHGSHVERRVSNVTPGAVYAVATWTDDSPDCWRP